MLGLLWKGLWWCEVSWSEWWHWRLRSFQTERWQWSVRRDTWLDNPWLWNPPDKSWHNYNQKWLIFFLFLVVPYQLEATATKKTIYFDHAMSRNSTQDFLADRNKEKNEPQIACRKCLEEQEWQAVCLGVGALSHSWKMFYTLVQDSVITYYPHISHPPVNTF